LDHLLRLLHPLIPFITEEVWRLFGEMIPERGLPAPAARSKHLIVAQWPEADTAAQDATIEEQFAKFQASLGALREIRARQGIAPKQSIEFSVTCDAETVALLKPMEAYFTSMANATNQGWGPDATAPATAATVTVAGMDVHVDLKDFIDVDAEIARLEKQVERMNGQIAGKEKKLSNANFVDRAPADVVQRERETLEEMKLQLQKTQASLEEFRKNG
jgi:valyl-tRNA synthetase